jgi:hypothetical protein
MLSLGKRLWTVFKTRMIVMRTMQTSQVSVLAYMYAMLCQVIDTLSAFALSSSIHTIHRPMAHIRRRSTAVTTASSGDSSIEEEEGDFDPHMLSGQDPHGNVSAASPRPDGIMGNAMMRRSTSLATIKVQRRAKLAEKLKEVFDVKELQEVLAGLSPFLDDLSCS